MHEGISTTSTAGHGNARWMAPERLDPPRYGLRPSATKSTSSDVFEMMRTFFQILTGKVPFHEETSDNQIPRYYKVSTPRDLSATVMAWTMSLGL